MPLLYLYYRVSWESSSWPGELARDTAISPTGASPLGDTTIRRACLCPRWTKTEKETSPQSHLDLGGKEGTAQTARMTPTILANGRDRLLFAIFGCSLFALADLSLDTISCTIQPQECSHFLTALNLDHSAWGK